MIRIRSQASGDYDPSFATEVLLNEIQYSDTPNQDVNLLKDVAVTAYFGQSADITCLFSVNGAIPQLQQILLFR